MAVEVTAATFEAVVLKSDKPVVIDFYASWCGPCRMMAPAFDELSHSLANDYTLVKVSTENDKELAIHYRITSIPALVFIKDGKEVGRLAGARSKEQLKRDIETMFK